MNRKIIFSILASFSLFSCFGAADGLPIKGILKKPLCVTSFQAEDMGMLYLKAVEEGPETIAKFKKAVEEFLKKHSYCKIEMVDVVGQMRVISLNPEAREKALLHQETFENGIGGKISSRSVQQPELGFTDLLTFQQAFYPVLVSHLQIEY